MKWPVSNEKAWIQEALCLLQFLSTLLIFLSQKLAFCFLYSFIVFYLLVPRPTIQSRAFFIVVPPLGMDSPWKSASCLEIILNLRFGGCLRLICIAVVGLGSPREKRAVLRYPFFNHLRYSCEPLLHSLCLLRQ